MSASSLTVAIPGQLLGPASRFKPGPGTHLHDGNIFASVLGTIATTDDELPSKPEAGPQKRLHRLAVPKNTAVPTVSVNRATMLSDKRESEKKEVLPEVGNVVLCRVMRITPRQAVVAILVVNDSVLEGEWQGVIRGQDVRATEKDKVKIYESFRPGDIVRAKVISLGDQANYYLSTTSNELGVMMATSEAGNVMYPVSWKEFRDPETGFSESRKVAKPF